MQLQAIKSGSKTRLYEIDLLRFLAAISVVFFHYTFSAPSLGQISFITTPILGNIFQYGYLGVDLFFIISGFVVVMSAFGKSSKSFLVSRAIRLYPAFWVSVTLTTFATLVLGGRNFTVSLFQYLTNLSMFSSFFGIKNIDGVYWTLGVELRFYAIIFLILLFKKIHQLETLLLLWLIPAFIHSFFGIFSLFRFFFIVPAR